ncbi:MAG: hypothetical protein HN548_01385 [Opitutae bacterium]|jgi:hypothetical protein|nr:hypothetical protein [Opitutae bacterium]
MTLTEEYSFGGDRILTCMVPSYEEIVISLLTKLANEKKNFQFSHQIGGRWENSYLSVDLVPSVRVPMRLARNLVKEKWGISTIVLFEPLAGSNMPHPPFWFNIANVGEKTGIHDHAKLAIISGVVYLQCNSDCGELFFTKNGYDDLLITPEEGKMVLFPSSLKHGVQVNKSAKNRISLAFNLFPFPLPSVEW